MRNAEPLGQRGQAGMLEWNELLLTQTLLTGQWLTGVKKTAKNKKCPSCQGSLIDPSGTESPHVQI